MNNRIVRLVQWLLVSVLVCGCPEIEEDEETSENLESCDPLEKMAVPIELGEVIAIGQDAAGVIYVLSELPDIGNVVFVLEDCVLRRKDILGSGEGTEQGDKFYQLNIKTDDAPLVLLVEISDGDKKMAVVRGDEEFEGKLADIDKDGEALSLMDESEISDIAVENLPGEVEIEYHAEVENGDRILVTRPTYDWDYEDFRLFYGNDGLLAEREVLDVNRARDGGSTNITFILDGNEVEVHFPHMEADSIDLPEGSLDVSRLDETPEALADYSFSCMEE